MNERLREMADTTVGALRGIFVQNFHLKAIALLLTCALYLWVGEDRETQMVTALPVNIEVPEDQVLLQPKLDRVKVTLRGRWSALKDFDQEDLKPVLLELTTDDDGQAIHITPSSVRVPSGLQVASIEPSVVRVEMEPKIEKRLAIRPRIVGRTRGPYEVGDVTSEPTTVLASGPEDVMKELSSIPTEPIDVTGRVRSFSKKRVQLRPEHSMVTYQLDGPVTVDVPITSEEIERTLRSIEVRTVNTTYDTTVEPERVDVTVRGPRTPIEKIDSNSLHAIIDLSAEDDRPPGTFEKEVKIRNLPQGVSLVRRSPKHFVITTRSPAPEESAATDSSPDRSDANN